MGYEVLDTPVPGITIVRTTIRKNLCCRIYRKDVQQTVNRSCGTPDLAQARQWVLDNLGDLFATKAAPRGAGNNSIKKHLSQHIEWQRSRMEAGSIAAATFEGYSKSYRHFLKWFPAHGYKRLTDIKRTSLTNYGLDRVNKDGMSASTANFEIVFLKAFWRWLQDEEVLTRPIRINSVQRAVENRIGGEPFAPGDLKKIHSTIKEWRGESKEHHLNQKVSKFNKELFALFIQLLEESGCRQHELWNRTWRDVRIGETLTNRKRMINTVSIPQKAKRGARQCVFRGEALVKIRELQKKMCPSVSEKDYIFRSHQTNTLIDISTFSRYWGVIKAMSGTEYRLHTFRSHRITQLVLGGVEPQLVARNLGLSVNQIESTYLRFVPAGQWQKLVQRDTERDLELRMVMSQE